MQRVRVAPGNIPETAPESTRRNESRLTHLYEVARLLLGFGEVDETLKQFFTIVTHAIPLSTGVLIDNTNQTKRIFSWNAEGVKERQLRAAHTHARVSFTFLTGSRSLSEERPPQEGRQQPGFVVLPLVVGRDPVFGSIQFEARDAIGEQDLTFVATVTKHLAVALDQHKYRAIQKAAKAQAEAAEGRMTFLAEASRLFRTPLDYKKTVEGIAQLAVRNFADFCIVETQTEHMPAERKVFPSDQTSAKSSEMNSERLLRGVAARVARTGQAVIYPNRTKAAAPDRPGNQWFLSYMCIPLSPGKNATGTLSFISVTPERAYTSNELQIVEDLAHRIVYTLEASALYAAALQAVALRDELLNTVSHDLKGPLAIVIGFIDVFLSRPEPKELVCDRSQVDAIRRSASRMNRLIQDLLDSAILQGKGMPLELASCDAGVLLREALELHDFLATQKSVRMEATSQENLPLVVLDRHRILQVLSNLIGNAIKFTPEGGTILTRVELVPGGIQFSVADSGMGISRAEIPFVFGQFWQSQKTTAKGTGLGLFIARGIVESHGGWIWAESKPGSGSRFSFVLPLRGESLKVTS